MALSAGTRLGPYEIVAPLGAGGMGEVHRARDTRLERDVAIKVLPQQTADDPSALARFRREAQAIAALQHPNILALYDVGVERATTFAVMELLECETLRARISDSPLPWRRAVAIGVEIAEGLAAAHAKGVIHRDLKPENVFLTTDGRVKDLAPVRGPRLPARTRRSPRRVARVTSPDSRAHAIPPGTAPLTRTDPLLWIWLSRVWHEWHVWGPTCSTSSLDPANLPSEPCLGVDVREVPQKHGRPFVSGTVAFVGPNTSPGSNGRRVRFAVPGIALFVCAACASLPKTHTCSPSSALADTVDSTSLGRVAARRMTELNGPSGIKLIPRGPDAFLARLTLVDLAERSLDLQYYIWHDDTVGKLLVGAVMRAAGRGVRVRLLIDDVGASPDDRTLLLLDSHPNIEVRLFNPISSRSVKALWMISDFSRVNRRMHNKSITADNQITIVGGRNIGDEYFEASTVMNYADLDALAIGAAVAAVSARFDRY